MLRGPLAYCLGFSLLWSPLPAEPAAELPREFQFLPAGLSEEFDFRGDFEFLSPEAAVEVAVNWQSEGNAYVFRICGVEASLSRLQQGVELPATEPLRFEAGPEGPARIVIKRRTESLRLYVGGALVAETFDRTFLRGKLGVRASAGRAGLARPAYQPVDGAYFSDDFMRSEIQGVWDKLSGQWGLQALPNVSMSANAFHLVGTTGVDPAIAVTGHAFWDSYCVEASVRMQDDGRAGIVAYLQDARNYYALEWQGAVLGRLELVKVIDGRAEPLASRALPFQLGHWYRLSLLVSGGALQAAIDGREVLSARDHTFFEGPAGLLSGSAAGAHFDDVSVSASRDIRDPFDGPDNRRWRRFGGRWSRGASMFGGVFPGDPCLRVSGPDEARMLLCHPVSPRCVFEVDTFAPSGEFGLCFFYLDEQNYWLAKFSEQGAALVELREGNQVEHDKAPGPFPAALRRIGLRIDQNVARITVDGRVVLSGAGEEAVRGSLGLYAARSTDTAFDNVAIRLIPPARPVFIQHQVFGGEKTMANWSVAQSDWTPDTWDDAPAHWHRGSFPGDVTINVRLPAELAGNGKLRVRLGVADRDPGKGCEFDLEVGAQTSSIRIRQGGRVLAERAEVPFALPCTASFSRHGAFLTVRMDGLPRLHARLPEPVTGTEIGWSSSGLGLGPENIEILSDQCEVYTFKVAPVDWAPASGNWQVTNRWTCDPRWSFFSGFSAELAALWNKRPFRDDVTVEFAAGIKMDNARGGGRYANYASDINVTLCGDGKDLTTGYSFIFGGWRNSVSRILRNNQTVAETRSSVIPTSGLHRRWLYFKAQRRGNELSFWVDNTQILRFEDPNPLPGDRVALWTWQNGIMVARVRISAGEFSTPALPQPAPGTWGTCVYNHPGQPGPVQAQLARLKSDNAEEIAAAAIELARLREPSTIPSLVPLLEHQDDNCRWQGALALAAIGLPGIEALLKALDTPKEEARWKAEAALRRSGPEAVPLFDEVLRNGTAAQRRSCAYILRDIPCEGTYQALARALGDADDDVRWKAADSLVQSGESVVPSVARVLRTENVRARQAAAWVLHQVGSAATVKPLLGALNDADKDVRWKAAIALKEMEPRPEKAVLEAGKETGRRSLEHLDWILQQWKIETAGVFPETLGRGDPHGEGSGAEAETTDVSIATQPAGASVFLDDEFLGISPGRFPVPQVGKHLLTLRRAGYAPGTRVLDGERPKALDEALKPMATRALTITSSPRSASVFLDNDLKGKTPLRIPNVMPGPHGLRLEREGCFPLQQTLDLAPNQDQRLHLTLIFKAERFYGDALKKDPNNASYRTELAHLYLLRNAFDLAHDQLLQAYRLVSNGKDTSSYAGRLQQEVQKALTAFFDYGDEKAVAQGRQMMETVYATLTGEFPTNVSYWAGLSGLQQQRGAWEQAVKTLSAGTKRGPDNWAFHYHLGLAQYAWASHGGKGLKGAILSSLQKARALTPDAKVHQQIDQYLAAAGKLAN